MKIKDSELKELPLLSLSVDTHNNGGIIYIANNKIVYKIFKDHCFFQSEVERNMNFLIKNSIPNTPKIYDIVFIDGKFLEYAMEYIHNTITFRQAIGKKLELQMKLKAIQDIYDAIKYLHQNNIFLGDVHSDNFLISADGKGYIIDLDYMRFPGDEYKFEQCYLIKPNNQSYKINIASKYTDNIKVMVSCLSLLLDIDLENFISQQTHSINIEELYNKVIIPLNCSKLNDYFRRLINQEDVEYFSDCLIFKNIFPFSKSK